MEITLLCIIFVAFTGKICDLIYFYRLNQGIIETKQKRKNDYSYRRSKYMYIFQSELQIITLLILIIYFRSN